VLMRITEEEVTDKKIHEELRNLYSSPVGWSNKVWEGAWERCKMHTKFWLEILKGGELGDLGSMGGWYLNNLR
jgi:hypothetical protein